MDTQLLTLSKIFPERLFRIPDYPRGYTCTPGGDSEMTGKCLFLVILLILVFFMPQNSVAQTTYFSDDFENGLSNWSVSGSDWDTTSATSRGGEYSITDSPDSADFAPDANSTLTLAYPIDLSAATSPVLSYWTKYYFPDCGGRRLLPP